MHKKNYPAGQHGPTIGRRKKAGYAEQLESTQVLRGYYGNITKRQFTRIVKEAVRRRGDNTENLIGLLESRLDAIVYRAKFAPTPFAARQLVNHGHILVNGKRVNIASYRARVGDVVSIRQKSRDLAIIATSLSTSDRAMPEYLHTEGDQLSVKYVKVPTLAEVPYPVEMKPSLVIEFFSM